MKTTIHFTFQPLLLFQITEVLNWLGKVTDFCMTEDQKWPIFIDFHFRDLVIALGNPTSIGLTIIWKMEKLDLVIDSLQCRVIAVKIKLSEREGNLVTFKISPSSHRKTLLCHLEEFCLYTDQGSFVMPELYWGFPKTSFFFCVVEAEQKVSKHWEPELPVSQMTSTLLMASMGQWGHHNVKMFYFKSGAQIKLIINELI